MAKAKKNTPNKLLLRELKDLLHNRIGDKRFTQRAIAERCGFSQAYVSMALSGGCPMPEALAVDIASLLSISTSVFYNRYVD